MRATIAAVALLVSSAHALSRQELACQDAIGHAGKAFVAAELTSRARCKLAVARGRACDPAMRTAVHAAKLRKVVSRCSGVALSALGTRSCAATSTNTSELADCLIEGHEAAVTALIDAQFGLTGVEREVVVSGQIAQANATLLPPANLLHYKLSTSPVTLTDLELFCVTFEVPPVSAHAAVAADGTFSVRLTAVGVPFGCSVVDAATGEQMATLVFRTGSADTSQIHVDEGGTLALGTVSLDLGAGEAVVNATSLGAQTTCPTSGGSPSDFSGLWQLQCIPPPDGAGYSCPAADAGGPPSELYLHRVSGTDAAGAPVYWLGFWDDVETFQRCGGVEGLATVPAGTATAAGETLATPDGPFAFASPTALHAAIDATASPAAGGGTSSVCNATAAQCTLVQNNDGAACTEPGTNRAKCWGRTDVDEDPVVFVPFTDEQCQALCFAMNLYVFDSVESAVATAGLCAERKLVDFSVTPDQAGALISTGSPFGRHLFGPLRYACDDAGSVVRKDPVRTVILPQAPGATGPVKTCHVTQRTEITLRMQSSTRVIGSYKRSASLQPGDPDACANGDDPNNPVARLLESQRVLFKLVR